MKKILWLCNVAFSNRKLRGTGTWLEATSEALVDSGFELSNITFGNVKKVTRSDAGAIKQWLVPKEKLSKKGLPSKETIQAIKSIESHLMPDLIQIWGTESYWGMLAVNKIIKSPVILEMQGMLHLYEKVYYGGLSTKDVLNCIGLKEILFPKLLLQKKKKNFREQGKLEKIIIKGTDHISVQSEWVNSVVQHSNPSAKIYSTKMLLRKQFYNAATWQHSSSSEPTIFTSSSGSVPYKGLYVVFRVLSVLKDRYPNLKVRIAGNIPTTKSTWRRDGYTNWLLSEAKKCKVEDAIEWLGPLDVNEIIKEIQQASVVVIPSYIETYCLALAEAMYLGAPVVVSYSSAMTELAKDGESALYFPIGDHISCAAQVEKVLSDKSLATKLGKNARETGIIRNAPESFIDNQISIYNEFLKSY